MKITTLPYWGQINGVISQDAISLFTTRLANQFVDTSANKKSLATLYRVDSSTEHPTLTTLSLPVAMDGLTAMPDSTVVLIGQDGHLYQSDWQAKKIAQLTSVSSFDLMLQSQDRSADEDSQDNTQTLDNSPSSNPKALAIASLPDGVVVLYPNHLLVWSYQKHKLGDCIAHIRLDSLLATTTETNANRFGQATTLAVSADGDWLVIGDSQGMVASFHFNPERTALLHSSSETLHQGAVTALCFEPIAQQFFSAGADKQLLRTHVQGKLQGIDRGKASQHTEMIRAMAVSGERLYTGSDDKTIKSWQFDKGQPNTCKEDSVKVRLLTVCQYLNQPSILAVGTDQSLRFIPIDKDGKLTNVAHIIKDGYQRLTDLLNDKEANAFKEGLSLLAEYHDNNRLTIVSKILNKLTDGYRSEQLARWLASTDLPKTTQQLEQLLASHKVEKVREIAFNALKQQNLADMSVNSNPPNYLQLALDSQFVDVNEKAIAEYLAIAQQTPHLQNQILPILQTALTHRDARIRKQALSALETLLPPDSPKADLLALATHDSEIQQAGLIRLYQREMLANFEVKRQLVLLQNDSNALVRQTAFYVAVLSQPLLAKALSKLDEQFTRTLQDFADFRLLPKAKSAKSHTDTSSIDLSLAMALSVDTDISEKKPKAKSIPTLDTQSLEPLLQGLSSQYTDISFRSAYALALLQDERAFGALMRLMHDNDDNTRIGVAKAFGELGQVDSLTVLPLLLDDSNATVRQVAMQSYGKLAKQHGLSLLDWACVGFASREQDVHQQALAILLANLNDVTDNKVADNKVATDLLTQALNDPFAPIRQEVVKILIQRLSNATDEMQSDIFALLKQSQFVDVHQVALAEWETLLRQTKSANHPVILQLLQEFLTSPFQAIRDGAWQIALREHKRIPLKTLLSLAFESAFVDIRQTALSLLTSQKTPELMPLVTRLFEDENADLRLQALKTALGYGDKAVLQTALSSHYSDIQLATAQALAKQGDDTTYAIFEHFLNQPMPEMADEKAQWQKNIIEALYGLSDLGDPRGFVWFDKYLHDPNVDFSKHPNLASHIIWVTDSDKLERLVEWQTDDRPNVKQSANFALAVWGDKRGEVVLKDDKQASSLSAEQWLQAAVGLGVYHANQLRPALHRADTALASCLVLAFHDLLLNPRQPKRLLEALAFANNETALFCAGVITHFADSVQAWQYIADHINHRLQQAREAYKSKHEAVWAMESTTLQQLAQLVVFGSPILRAKAIGLLTDFSQNESFEAWQTRWLQFVQLNAATIADINAQHPFVFTTDNIHQQHWQALVFGAWLGIVRQADYSSIGIAQQAMRALLDLAQHHPQWQDSVQRAFIPLLNHQVFSLRELAWQSLQELGMSAERLGEQAMSSPYVDIVQKGLALWLTTFETNSNTAQTNDQANIQLQRLLQTNSPVLTQEAYRLLVKRMGALQAGQFALDSYYLPLRSQVVNEWRQVIQAERQADKLTLLNLASQNDDWQTRLAAVSQLLVLPNQLLNDNQLLKRIVDLWQHSSDIEQQRTITSLLTRHHEPIAQLLSQQPHQADLLLALLDSPQRKVYIDTLYALIAQTRSVAFVPALIQRYLQKTDERADIVKTIIKISGFDQPIQDYRDEYTDKRWLEKQHPRHVHVLLDLADLLLQHTDYLRFINLLDNLAWANDARNNAKIDNLLQRAYTQLPNHHTANIVKAMAYRAEKRQGDATGLRKALSNRDSQVQFLAAEGLAKQGIKDGFAILMATIDYNTDGELRRRAVLALGELADEQAYDKLIQLANDSEHYLQDVASEALGHLGKTDYGQRIFNLLKTHLQQADDENPAIDHWVNGLRWLNTYESWQQIREFIERSEADPYTFWDNALHAIKTLQYHPVTDDIGNANRNLILKLIRTSEDDEMIEEAIDTAQALWGNDTDIVYPYDWAVLESLSPTVKDRLSIERVSQYASLDALLNFINQYPQLIQQNHCHHLDEYDQATGDELIQRLTQAILERENLPAPELHNLLVSDNARSQELGLRYLIQNPQQYWDNSIEQSLWQQLHHSQNHWQQLVTQVSEQPSLASTQYNRSVNAQHWQSEHGSLTTIISQLLWLLIRFSPVNSDNIAQTLTWLLTEQKQTITQAITFLANSLNAWLEQSLLALLARPNAELATHHAWHSVLEQVDYWSTAQLQQLAQKLLAHIQQPSVIAEGQSNRHALEKPVSFSQQLIIWVKQNNAQALYQLATDENLAENHRISAIEGLGQLTIEQADDVIPMLTHLQQQDSDADIQRIAFSVLRRYQRRLTPKTSKRHTHDLKTM